MEQMRLTALGMAVISVSQSTADDTHEVTPEPTGDTTPEPTEAWVDPTAEPTAEMTPEPTGDMTPEPTDQWVDPTPGPTLEPLECNGRSDTSEVRTQPDGTLRRVCVCPAPYAGDRCEQCADLDFFLDDEERCIRCFPPEAQTQRALAVSNVSKDFVLPFSSASAVCLNLTKTVAFVSQKGRKVYPESFDVEAGSVRGSVECKGELESFDIFVNNHIPLGEIRCMPRFFFENVVAVPEIVRFHTLEPTSDGPFIEAIAIAAGLWDYNPATKVLVTRHKDNQVLEFTLASGYDLLRQMLMRKDLSPTCTLGHFGELNETAGLKVSTLVLGDLPKTCTGGERRAFGEGLATSVGSSCASCVGWIGADVKPQAPMGIMTMLFRDTLTQFEENSLLVLTPFFTTRMEIPETCDLGSIPSNWLEMTPQLPAESRRSIDISVMKACSPIVCCLSDGQQGKKWQFYESSEDTTCSLAIAENNGYRCPLPLARATPDQHELTIMGHNMTVSAPITLVQAALKRNYVVRTSGEAVNVQTEEPDNSRHCCRWVGIDFRVNVMVSKLETPFCWTARWGASGEGKIMPKVSTVFPSQPLAMSLQCAPEAEQSNDVKKIDDVPSPGEDLFHNVARPAAIHKLVSEPKEWLSWWTVAQTKRNESSSDPSARFPCPSTPSAPFENGFFGYRNDDLVMSVRQMSVTEDYRRSIHAHVCYEMQPSVTGRNAGFGVRCCYDETLQYIPHWPTRVFNAETELAAAAEANAEELACLSDATATEGGLSEACKAFSAARAPAAPVLSPFQEGLAWEMLPFSAWGHGDPHCETTDGMKYPCNFNGEARWAYCDDFRVHVVAAPVGTEGAGTVISRIAISYKFDVVEIFRTGTVSSDGVFAYLNGDAAGTSAVTESGLTIDATGDWNSLVVETPEGNRVDVHYVKEVDALALGLRLSAACVGRSQGLIGNSNGNADDDLATFDRSFILPAKATEQDIYDVVLQSHLILSPSESLFETLPFTAGNATYRPMFSSDLNTDSCPAECKNDTACCFDASVGGEKFATAYMATRQMVDDSNMGAIDAHTNFPPSITGPALTTMSADEEMTVVVFHAKDADGIVNFSCSICSSDKVTCESTLSAENATVGISLSAVGSFNCTAVDKKGAKAVVRPSVVQGAKKDHPHDEKKRKNDVVPIVIGSVVGGLVLLGLVGLCVFMVWRHRRQASSSAEQGSAPFGSPRSPKHEKLATMAPYSDATEDNENQQVVYRESSPNPLVHLNDENE